MDLGGLALDALLDDRGEPQQQLLLEGAAHQLQPELPVVLLTAIAIMITAAPAWTT